MLGTETYPKQVAENWDLIERLPPVIGEFTWTGWDYVGELSEPYPAWQNTSGDVDAFGFRRPVSYWREIVFGLRTDPYLAVRPPEAHDVPRQFGPWKFTDAVASWTWDVAAGTPMTVEVYAPNGAFELRLNGRVVAQGATSDCYALVEVPYEAGVLTVAGPDGQRHTLRTAAGAPYVVCDDSANGDWLFSRIHLEDEAGTWVFGTGQEHDCTREGFELVAAAGEQTALPPLDSRIRLVGQGALALYRHV
jgi:hypothetical protein